jgi:nucleotide-binding universal stress UspA family protein
VRTSRRPVLVARNNSSKPSIRRITVALDLSRGCHVVLEHAIGLAIQLGAELDTVYVLPDPVAADTTQVMASIVEFTADRARKAARGRIDAHFDSVVKNLDIPFAHKDAAARLLKDRKLLVGAPAAELVRHVAENDRDLLVIGSQDATRNTTQRIGDVASSVLRAATGNVLVIPL